MTFYQKCLGGNLHFQFVGDAPRSEALPENLKNVILHATLSHETWALMATDLIVPELSKGNSLSLFLECDSEKEIYELYYKLSEGGKPTHPPDFTYWGAVFGSLRDRFGVSWLLNYRPTQ